MSTIVALALGSAGCRHTPSPPGSGSQLNGPTLLYVMPHSRDAHGYVPIRINGQSPSEEGEMDLIGNRLKVYGHGSDAGTVRISAVAQDDGLGCTDIGRITFDKKSPLRTRKGTFIGTYSANPDRRFTQRSADTNERVALLNLAQRIIRSGDPGQLRAYSQLLEGLREDADAVPETLAIFMDNTRPGYELALLSLAVTQPLDAASEARISPLMTADIFEVFERTGTSSWQARFSRNHAGCEDCDARPDSFHFIAHGDFNQDGRLDFLLSREAYETWEYVVLWNSSRDWETESLTGGGC